MKLGTAGAQVIRVATTNSAPPGLDIHPVLNELSERGITRLMVEGGSKVASSFLASRLVDEIWLFRGPAGIGADGVAALGEMPLSAITQSPRWMARVTEMLDKDTLTIYERT
jgi:diaminohydroxyphosphoribosylaminopyrimidine deaminase/5-amino-6-(5-phosphoribosylamino)uracil reductase